MEEEKKPTPPVARPTQGAFEPVEFDYNTGKRIAKHSRNFKRDEVAQHTSFNEHDPQQDD